MYIVPIAIRERSASVKQIWILLERNGSHLISLESGTDAHQFADLNGLVLASEPVNAGPLTFLPVDMDRTDMSSFYSWREVVPGTVPSKEVWRQFVWVSDSLDVNKLLNDIVVGEPDHTVFSILRTYLKTNH